MKIKLICKHCNKEYLTDYYRKDSSHYCSNKCYRGYRKVNKLSMGLCKDCGILLKNYKSKRCKSCETRNRNKEGKLNNKGIRNHNFKDGRTLKDYYCIDCNKKIKYRSKRCKRCEAQRKIDQGITIGFLSGEKHFFYNKHHSIQTKQKISLNKGGTGIPYEHTKYGDLFTKELKNKIRKRDNYACQICGKLQSEDKSKLDVHHIDYNKKNCAEDNLISLCRGCHSKTNINRPYWKQYFEERRK